MSLATMLMLAANASVAAAAAEREKSLAWLSSILGVPVEINEHGAIELTDDQLEILKAAAPNRAPISGEPTWTGIPIWPVTRSSAHRFPPSGSAHGGCGRCLACPTCEPDVAADPCSGDPEWMRLRARQEPTD